MTGVKLTAIGSGEITGMQFAAAGITNKVVRFERPLKRRGTAAAPAWSGALPAREARRSRTS